MNKLATQNRTKTSVRLDPDVVDIIAAYAKVYTGNDKTKALNDLIRATQEPPNTPQNIQASYEPPIATHLDPRVEKLEQLVSDIQQQLTRLTSKLDDQELTIEDLEQGQHITGQHSRLYNLLVRTDKQEQTYLDEKGKGTKYQWFKDLGLITATDAGRSRSNRIKYRVVGVLEPNTQLELTSDGGFIHHHKKWYQLDTTEDDELGITSATQEPPEVTQVDPSIPEYPLSKTIAELAQHLAKTSNEALATLNVLSTLGGLEMKRDKIIPWTSERDPLGRSWYPTDKSREHWRQISLAD